MEAKHLQNFLNNPRTKSHSLFIVISFANFFAVVSWELFSIKSIRSILIIT